MKEKIISVTEASRNFADCVSRVYYQGATFVVTKNGVPVARIAPPEQPACTGAQLVEALKDVRLTREERKAFADDVRNGLENLNPPEDRWG